MGRFGLDVIDVDSHMFESQEMFQRLLDDYVEPTYRGDLAEMIRGSTDSETGKVNTPDLWRRKSRSKDVVRDKALGGVPPGIDKRERGEGRKTGTRAAIDVLDPSLRVLDLDEEGIDVTVIFPSVMIGFSALDDLKLESALYRAYNDFMADFCRADAARLKYVAVISQRDIDAGVAEARRVAGHGTAVGLYTQTHMDGKQLDHAGFYPLWEEAQAHGLAITVHHGSAGLPPWGLGVFEMGDNWFQQHASVFLYEQMRAVATVIGGGLLEQFPKLTFAFLESGCGWLPYWLERLDHHYKLMPQYVPLLTRKPSEAFAAGQCFISCDPDEVMLADAVDALGDQSVVYASDYPHFDCKFPDTVRLLVENKGLSTAAKARIFEDNAVKLYPRLA
ncbi:MAG: amidohydrolase [Chloroflexi bacterium]|nr:amidohydrolase [Chloroflexota bacterium]